MDTDSSFRVGLLIVGVVLIVVGAGLVVVGYNQTQAAAEWSSRPHYCGTAGAFEDVGEVSCPTNPYSGGEGRIGIGIVLAVVGGLSMRFGTQ